MKPMFVVLALFLAIPALADMLPPACVPDTVHNYIAQVSCSEEPFILKNFAWDGAFGSVVVNDTQVDFVPTSTPGQFGLNFTGAGGPNPFSVSGTQTISAMFGYTIDPRPPILNGVTLSLSPTSSFAAVRPGTFATTDSAPFAGIKAVVCVGDTFKADGCQHPIQPLIFLNVDTTNLQESINFDHSVSVVDFLMRLDMKANLGSISINGGGVSAQAVPEPGSAALALSGVAALLGLGIRRFRR
jgi:hypothetical protein